MYLSCAFLRKKVIIANLEQSLGVFDPRGFSPKNTSGQVTQASLLGCYETNPKSQYKSHQSNCPIQRDATPPLSETQSSRPKEEEEEISSEKEGSY
jgi:hypothetical protein